MRPVIAAIVATCILAFMMIPGAFAGPVGAPAYNIWHRPIGFSASAGVGFGQRDIHVAKQENIRDELNSSLFITKINLAPANFVELYGLVGAADIQLDDGDYKGSLVPAFGGGIRPALFPSFWKVESNFHLTLDGQYMTFTTEDNDIKATMHEGQAAIILAYVMRERIAPYGGLKYDYAYVEVEGAENDLKGDVDFAVFVGCDYFVTAEVFFNVELNIFSETRVFAGVGYKY